MQITWQPISLLFKNDPPEGSEYFDASAFTHGMLRVMESVRAGALTPEDGNERVFRLYWELGSRIHHDGSRDFTAADALGSADLDVSHADAFDDTSWDDVIRTKMDDGLALTGTDVGTPIIATTNGRGERAGYFGPVINELPDTETSLRMWDALVAMIDVDSFFELKRTRSGGLHFPERPAPRAR